jgi:hypothetical protein
MWPYSELGIEPDADERAVKRAYALKLKRTRPDENPEGFQRLHEAYQAALQSCHAAASRPAEPVTPRLPAVAAPEPAQAMPHAVPLPPPFDVQAFLHEAVRRAQADDPPLLRQWLEGCDALWSLSLKARVGQQWLAVVHQAAPPMPDRCFDEMLAFFRLDHAGALPDPLVAAQRRQHMHLAWHLTRERRGELVALLGGQNVSTRKRIDRSLRWLEEPLRWPLALWRSLIPQTIAQMDTLIVRLAGEPPVELPPPVNSAQQAFWLRAARGGPFSRTGAAIIGARILAALLLGLLFGAGLGAIAISDSGSFGWSLVGVGVATAAALSTVFLVFIAWSQLTLWQRRFVPVSGALGWLHFTLVPLLALAGLAIIDGINTPMLGWGLVIPALWLALARVLHGRALGESLRSWLRVGVFLIYPVSRLVAGAAEEPAAVGNVLASAALLAWGIDAWRRRPMWRRAMA